MTGAASSERRLVVISYHHPPDGAIGGMRWAGLTKFLAPLGWKSWIVTAAPAAVAASDAGTVVISCPRRTTLNDVYRRMRLRGSAVGASFPPRGTDASASNGGHSAFAQLRLEAGMLLSLPDDGRGWVWRAAARARRLIREVQPDAVVSTGPPHSAHLVGWLATRGLRTRWLVDFRDPWAGPVTDAWRYVPSYRSRLARFVNTWLERLVVSQANDVLCNTKEFGEAMTARYPGAAVHWLPNGVDTELLPAAREPLAGLGLVYVGTMYGGRDLRTVLQALRLFLDRHPGAAEAAPALRVAGSLEGRWRADFEHEISELGLERAVEYLGVLPRVAALELLARSRLGVVLAQEQEYQVPAKLYELMAIGIQAVVIAEAGSAACSEARRVGAITVDPSDVGALVRLMDDVWTERMPRSVTPRASVDYADLAARVSELLAGA